MVERYGVQGCTSFDFSQCLAEPPASAVSLKGHAKMLKKKASSGDGIDADGTQLLVRPTPRRIGIDAGEQIADPVRHTPARE